MKIVFSIAEKFRMTGITQRLYRFIFDRIKFESIPCIESCNDPQYIVSMTSWEPRFDDVPFALKSILLQTKKPDKVILYYGNDVDRKKIPEDVLKYRKKGIEIRFANENLRAHKKYYYAMKDYPDSTIITVDDDVIYSPFTISSLVKTSKKYKNTVVCARRAHRIIHKNKVPVPYAKWKYNDVDDSPRFDLMAVGVGGVLYPPHSLHLDLFSKDDLKNIAFTNDDFWLKGMELLHGTKVKSVDCLWKHPILVAKDDANSLYSVNVVNCENDRIVERMIAKYPDIFNILED